MPNNDGTLRDILTGFNQMQSRLGLTPGSQQAQGIQPLSTPVKHPGEVSQEMSIRLMQSTQATRQSIQQIQQMQQPNAMAFMPSGGSGGGAGGQFSRQYQQRMGQIESGYQDPYQAQQMAQQSGQPGFMTLPSPTFMTPPSMGVFRPGFQAPPPIAMARTPPMIQTPLTPQLPQPMFQTPGQMQHAQAQMESNQMFAGAMAGIPMAARAATGLGGVAGGAALGRRIGGGMGAIAGGIGGGLLGFGAGGALAEQGAQAALQPAIERRTMGLQMQSMSRNFVTSGSQLDASGRGLSTRAGIQTANQMRSAVNQEETSGFNMRDMMGITSMAGNMGMMDMAQNSDQIVGQAKNIAKGLSAFMQLANEPDVRRAMQQMSQMRQMGMTIPETTQSMQNAQKFARMAGTNVADLGATAGMPGAMTFQRMGMTAGLGYDVGMGAGGMARQATASGAFTPGQLSMAGGMRGIQQQMTEAAGATMGINFPMMAMLERNEQGKLTINKERAQRIASGDVSLTEQASMAQQNVERLGGAKVITELSTRLNELRDQLGKTLGPQGTLLMTLGQAKAMKEELGPGATLGGALRAIGLNAQQARTMEVMAQSPKVWQGMQQQMQMQKDEARQEEASRREQARGSASLTAQMGRSALVRGAGRAAGRIGEMYEGAQSSVSQWFSGDESARRAADQDAVHFRESDALKVTSSRVQKSLGDFVSSGGFSRFTQRHGAEISRGTGDEPAGEFGSVAWEASPFGQIGQMFSDTGTAETSNLVRAQRAGGGLVGLLAQVAPSLTYTASVVAGTSEKAIEHGKSLTRAANQLTRGTALSESAMGRLNRETSAAFAEIRRQEGAGKEGGSYGALEDDVVQGIIGELENRSSWIPGRTKAMSADEMRKKAIEIAVGKGQKRAVAERIYSKARWEEQGIGDMVARRVKNEATEGAQASLAATEEAGGLGEAMAGKDLQKVTENLEKIEEKTKEQLGFYQGKRTMDFLDVTETSYKAVTAVMMGSKADEVLAAQAQALLLSDDEDDKKRGNEIRRKLRARLEGEGKDASKLIDRAAKRVGGMDEDTKKALRRTSGVLEGKTAEEQKEKVEKLSADLKGLRTAAQVARGATELSKDVEGLRGLAEGGFTPEATESVMEGIGADSAQMESLSKSSKVAAEAVEDLKEAGDDPKARAAAVRKFYQAALQRKGADARGEAVFGGKGVGGQREAGIDRQMGTVEKLAASFTGDAQGDFAKTVPLFAKASEQFYEATKLQREIVEKKGLLSKLLG